MSRTLLVLSGPDGGLELRTTDDDSTTRLHLDLAHRGHGVTSELDVDEAKALRAALTEWLSDGEHLGDEPPPRPPRAPDPAMIGRLEGRSR